jgi:predicted membrane-associated Zn-dependent protease 1
VGSSMLSLPQRVWELTVTLVTGGERSVESPVSVVGVSRIAGEVTATDRIDVKAKAAMLVSLVANMNLMLFAFNLIPLLPLDGGHVLGALWEGVRRFFARLTGRKDPGPFDPVKLLPLTYVVAGAFIVMSVILIVADIVKPITLF